jgi:signal recognition particle receptor subunit beta
LESRLGCTARTVAGGSSDFPQARRPCPEDWWMATINSNREIELKIVYYGPALCGKTTNLQQIHTMMKPSNRGKLMSLENVKDDRTIFFDLLPIKVPLGNGFTISAKLYTVPGQVAYNNTRKIVLQNVDAVVFVADSQRTAASANAYSFQNLCNNLKELKIDSETVPLVVQFNKRDMPDVRPMAELEAAWKERGVPVFAATAIRRDGVMTTLEGVLRVTFRSISEKIPMVKKYGMTEDQFLRDIMKNFDRPMDLNALYASFKDLEKRGSAAP